MLDPSGFSPPYTDQLCSGLAASGHEVTLFTTQTPFGNTSDWTYQRCDHFYRYTGRFRETLPIIGLAGKGLEHVWDLLRLERELRSWNPDVIHFQWFPLPIVDQWFLDRLRTIAPIVHTVHDSRPYQDSPSAWLQTRNASDIRGRATHLIAHTDYTKTQLTNAGIKPSDISIIPHGLLPGDLNKTKVAEGSPDMRILFFGTLKPYKGVKTLLETVALLPTEVLQEVTVHIAGRPMMDVGPLETLARSLEIDQYIEWNLGYIPEDLISAIFGRATVVALPYHHIDQSGVLMTAIHAGVPVVASDVGGMSETIIDGTHGILVPPGDPQAFADALTGILSDGERSASMERAMGVLAKEWPSWKEIGEETAFLYYSL